jgi:hypothetical protein
MVERVECLTDWPETTVAETEAAPACALHGLALGLGLSGLLWWGLLYLVRWALGW